MKIGSRVRVNLNSKAYSGAYRNLEGCVKSVYSGDGGNIAVLLDAVTNPRSGRGCFYFPENDLTEIATRCDNPFTIKNVIFNNPAVIVLWADGTKTVVKCGENDIFDPEKGLAMAISKKALGNQGNYYETFKKYLPEEEDIDDFGLHPEASLGCSWVDRARENLDDLIRNLKKPSSKSDKPAEKDDEPHLCSTCKHLCQSLDSLACRGCNLDKSKWEPAH